MRFLVVVFWWCGGWWGGSQCSALLLPIAGANLDQRNGKQGTGTPSGFSFPFYRVQSSCFADLRFQKLETGAGRVRGAVSDWWWAGSDAGGTPH